MSNSVIQDWIDLATDQGWRVVNKGGGAYQLFPPPGRAQPGYEVIHIRDTRTDVHRSRDLIRANLRRGGLKFPEDMARERKRAMQQSSTPKPQQTDRMQDRPPSPAQDSMSLEQLVASAHQDIDAAVNALSKLADKLGKIRAAGAKVEKVSALVQALREI